MNSVVCINFEVFVLYMILIVYTRLTAILSNYGSWRAQNSSYRQNKTKPYDGTIRTPELTKHSDGQWDDPRGLLASLPLLRASVRGSRIFTLYRPGASCLTAVTDGH